MPCLTSSVLSSLIACKTTWTNSSKKTPPFSVYFNIYPNHPKISCEANFIQQKSQGKSYNLPWFCFSYSRFRFFWGIINRQPKLAKEIPKARGKSWAPVWGNVFLSSWNGLDRGARLPWVDSVVRTSLCLCWSFKFHFSSSLKGQVFLTLYPLGFLSLIGKSSFLLYDFLFLWPTD